MLSYERGKNLAEKIDFKYFGFIAHFFHDINQLGTENLSVKR